MNGKKIFAVRGPSKVGKSSTIRLVREALLSQYPDAVGSSAYDIRNRVDIRIILMINGIKIGIESQGDPGARLEESLELFLREDCTIIVCATRTKGGTVEAVENLEQNHGYAVQWFEKACDETACREEGNLEVAKHIVDGIRAIVEVGALAR